MTCRFVMPFAKKCRIRFENRGAQEVTVTGSVLPLPWSWDPARSMHFRARWRVDHDLIARPGAGAQDLPFVVARGSGVYVGTAIMLLNPNSIPTPYGNWWGEGDEKIFVDDDVRPSTFGTGSEDYFNYSWSSPDIFVYPYCGQPRNDGPANRGFVVNHRWHIMDALPFHQQSGVLHGAVQSSGDAELQLRTDRLSLRSSGINGRLRGTHGRRRARVTASRQLATGV